MDGLAFGPGWTFSNRDGVSLRETSGRNRKVRRNGDREAPWGGTIRSVRTAHRFSLRGGFEDRSDWWAGKPIVGGLRIHGGRWNGPGGKAIRVQRSSGQGTMTIGPLEQQAFGHGSPGASLVTDFRI